MLGWRTAYLLGVLSVMLAPATGLALWSPDAAEWDPKTGMPTPAASWRGAGQTGGPMPDDALAISHGERRAELLKGLSERLHAGSVLDRAAWTRSGEIVEAPFLTPPTSGKPVLYSLVNMDKAARLVSGANPEGPTRDAQGRLLTGITIPEPATAWLLIAAGAVWAGLRRAFTPGA